jgi:LemA protein
MSIQLLVIVVLAPALLWLAWTWNRLVAMRAMLRAAWASVDVLLKRRSDLVPQLVTVVKGTMDYETDALLRITEARTPDLGARAAAEAKIGGAAKQLIALVESYPTLKANASALEFQKQLAETENDLAMARRYYNAVVRDYNTLRETFPTLLVAATMGFAPGAYFELDDEREAAVPSARIGRGS